MSVTGMLNHTISSETLMQKWCADKACSASIQDICMLHIDIGRCLTPLQRALRDRYAVQSYGTHMDDLCHHPAEDGRVAQLGNAKGALPKHPIRNQRVLQQAPELSGLMDTR